VGKQLKITQVKSYIGRPEAQRRVLRGMGLGKVNRTVLLNDTPEIRGMIRKVIHLVAAVEVEESGK
jgi:large subunit ribosomal protein L30